MYSVKIVDSSREFSKREAIKYKDTTSAIKIDNELNDGSKLIISPVAYLELDITNDASSDGRYSNYIIVDRSGVHYVTGSTSFWKAFKSIWEELVDDSEPWEIEVRREPSKKRQDKYFITCSLV